MENIKNEPIAAPIEPETQSADMDAKIASALASARKEWEASMEMKLQQMLSESARISQMTEAERAAYQTSRREADLAAREKQLMERELRAEALEILAQRGLPRELADAVNYANREAMLVALDNLERVYRNAVQQGIEQRMRGETPAVGASGAGDPNQMADEEYYRLNYASKH